jgi:putative transposase
MDEPSARIITRTSGMNPWRAGCGESRTSGSEGGPEKPTSRKTGRALRPDPYTEHPTREGKVYCCVVLDVFSRRVVGWAIDSHQATPLVTNVLGMAITNRNLNRPGIPGGSDS